MTRAEEIAALEAKLAASERMGQGYADRAKAIRAALDKLRDAPDNG